MGGFPNPPVRLSCSIFTLKIKCLFFLGAFEYKQFQIRKKMPAKKITGKGLGGDARLLWTACKYKHFV